MLTEPININLLDFFKSGKFHCVSPGQTKEWIANNFWAPDTVYRNNYESPIWHYGNIEFHFHDDDRLFLIYSDHIDSLTGGENITLNKWILKEPENLTLEYVIRQLNKERIGFHVSHKVDSQGFVSTYVRLANSGVGLGFAPEETEYDIQEFLDRCKIEDANGFRLQSFDLSNLELKIL